MEYVVIFSYEQKTIQIHCDPKEEMQKIFTRFAGKLNVNINDFLFFYEGKEINKNSSLLNLINKEKKKEIVVYVEKKVKIIKCPQCICNDCIIQIENYKIIFSNCKYNHNVYKIFDEYKESQKIDHSKIVCGDQRCGVNQKDNPSDFYKCLKCTQLTDHPRYYCENCNNKHEERHKRIKYDEKNYYCEKDCNEFKYYCLDCKQDLCNVCQKEYKHKGHKIHSYESMESMKQNITNIKENLNIIKDKINDLKFIIDDMKDHLDGAMKILEQYYEIGQDIIDKYELYNKTLKNQKVLQSINNLEISNEKVINDLDEILNEKDIKKQINNLINIYKTDRINYTEGIKISINPNNSFSCSHYAIDGNLIYNRKRRVSKLSRINSNRSNKK